MISEARILVWCNGYRGRENGGGETERWLTRVGERQVSSISVPSYLVLNQFFEKACFFLFIVVPYP